MKVFKHIKFSKADLILSLPMLTFFTVIPFIGHSLIRFNQCNHHYDFYPKISILKI